MLVTKFIIRVTKFVIHVTNFVTKTFCQIVKIVCAKRKNYRAESKIFLGARATYLRRYVARSYRQVGTLCG